jgi:hypothetical protein
MTRPLSPRTAWAAARLSLGASTGERLVAGALLIGVVVYAVLALLARRWVTGLAAPIVAGLLAVRHPRARFSAYVFFSVVALRGLVRGPWPLVAFGIAGVLVLQTPIALRAWPRLAPGTRRSRPGTRAST